MRIPQTFHFLPRLLPPSPLQLPSFFANAFSPSSSPYLFRIYPINLPVLKAPCPLCTWDRISKALYNINNHATQLLTLFLKPYLKLLLKKKIGTYSVLFSPKNQKRKSFNACVYRKKGVCFALYIYNISVIKLTHTDSGIIIHIALKRGVIKGATY